MRSSPKEIFSNKSGASGIGATSAEKVVILRVLWLGLRTGSLPRFSATVLA